MSGDGFGMKFVHTEVICGWKVVDFEVYYVEQHLDDGGINGDCIMPLWIKGGVVSRNSVSLQKSNEYHCVRSR